MTTFLKARTGDVEFHVCLFWEGRSKRLGNGDPADAATFGVLFQGD